MHGDLPVKAADLRSKTCTSDADEAATGAEMLGDDLDTPGQKEEAFGSTGARRRE
jgi:hypothetical protein